MTGNRVIIRLAVAALVAASIVEGRSPHTTCRRHYQCTSSTFCSNGGSEPHDRGTCEPCGDCRSELSTTAVCPAKCNVTTTTAAPTQNPPECKNHRTCPIDEFCSADFACLSCDECGPANASYASFNGRCPGKCAAPSPHRRSVDHGCNHHYQCSSESFCSTLSAHPDEHGSCLPCAHCTPDVSTTETCPAKCLVPSSSTTPEPTWAPTSARNNIKNECNNHRACPTGQFCNADFDCLPCNECTLANASYASFNGQCPGRCTPPPAGPLPCEQHYHCNSTSFCNSAGHVNFCDECANCHPSASSTGVCPSKCGGPTTAPEPRHPTTPSHPSECSAHRFCPTDQFCRDDGRCDACARCTHEISVDETCPFKCAPDLHHTDAPATAGPTQAPTYVPTQHPTSAPTNSPSAFPTSDFIFPPFQPVRHRRSTAGGAGRASNSATPLVAGVAVAGVAVVGVVAAVIHHRHREPEPL